MILSPEYYAIDTRQHDSHFSQLGQDVLMEAFLIQKNLNFNFCDIGAFDGVTYSNSYLFEIKYKWRGICVEPNPEIFVELKTNRKSINENLAICNSNGYQEFLKVVGYSNMLSGLSNNYSKSHMKRLQREVRERNQTVNKILIKCSKLQDLIDKHSLNNFGFISIDTEGSELEVLESLDLTKTHVTLFIIENSLGDRKVEKYLKLYGFHKALTIEYEEFYVKYDDVNTIQEIANTLFKKKSVIRIVVRKLYQSLTARD